MANFHQKVSRETKNSNDDELDLVDKLLNDTGCADFHYKVQVWELT